MSLPLKVLWSEGLTLDAQHFQQSDRYHEARLRHIAAAINPFFWGVQRAHWAIDAIRDNTLYAEALTIIFKDGEIVDAPLSDELPLPIDLGKLPLEEQSFTFYAALPVAKAHGGNVAGNGSRREDARYAMTDAETPDLYSDGLHVSVTYITKSLRLLSSIDVRDGYDSIPVARLRRTADGHFEMDPAFMPPSVSLDASASLREMLRGLVGKLAAKCEALYRMQRQSRGHLIEVPGVDASSFWMLNTVVTALASLSHFEKSGYCSPERLFESLRILAGGLMASSRKYSIGDLPGYEHGNPAPGFNALNAIIRDLLDTVASSRCVAIPLTVSDNGMRCLLGQLEAAFAAGSASLYVAVSANMPALNLVAEVPRQLKIASPNDIDGLVRSALPGIQLVHMPQVPMEIPLRAETYYFSIEARGELYEAMKKCMAIAIYAPNTFIDLRLELFAVSN